MTSLSVNINKVATIRNARGGDIPNLIQIAKDAQVFGAQGITVHPRPDERHIKYEDVYNLKDCVYTELNIEGYPNERFLQLMDEIIPEQCTLVPDPPDALTSNAGWNTLENERFLKEVVNRLKNKGIRVSLFMGNNPKYIQKAKEFGADRIELYTGPYAENFIHNKAEAIQDYKIAANEAKKLGLGVNAGHDLDLNNLAYLINEIPNISEVSIGHALISDTLYYGLENTIQMYLREIQKGHVSGK